MIMIGIHHFGLADAARARRCNRFNIVRRDTWQCALVSVHNCLAACTGCARMHFGSTILILAFLMSLCTSRLASAYYTPGAGLDQAMQRKTEGLALVADALRQAPGRKADHTIVAKAEQGRLTVVNACWWGFDPDDSTAALQAAIDTHAPYVVIPCMNAPWIVSKGLQLVSHQTILLESGAEILAKRGAFRHAEQCLITACLTEHLSMIGYGATLRMWRDDYQGPDYIHDEMRHIFFLGGVRNLELHGLLIAESGGDGAILNDGLHPKVHGKPVTSENVRLYDCRFDRNHRQGLSIEDARNFLAENCEFYNTAGTSPANGMDYEPLGITTREGVHMVFRNCRFVNNAGGEITVNRGGVGPDTPPDSILFDNCRFGGSNLEGIAITQFGDANPKPEGYLEFRDCLIENTGESAVRVSHKSALATPVRFVRCAFRNVATDWDNYPYKDREMKFRQEGDRWKGRPIFPFYVYLPHDQMVTVSGGFEFLDCILEDSRTRPILVAEEYKSSHGFDKITGTITLYGTHDPEIWVGDKAEGVDLQIQKSNRKLPSWSWEDETLLADLTPAPVSSPPTLPQPPHRPDTVSVTDFTTNSPDDTAAFQAAIDTRARVVTVPRHPEAAWLLGPLYLRGDQTIRLESGVVLQAVPDAFPDDQAGMFNILEQRNVRIMAEGDGATLRLDTIEYVPKPWNQAAFGRHGITLLGAGNVTIDNLHITGAPDNGISVGPNYQYMLFYPSTNVNISNCAFTDCRHGAVTIYSADGVHIENCRFEDNGPDGPGVCILPATSTVHLGRIRADQCRFSNMQAPALFGRFGEQIRYSSRPYPQRPMDINITNSSLHSSNSPAVLIADLYSQTDVRKWPAGRQTGAWSGMIQLRGCHISSDSNEAARCENKSALSARVRMTDCTLKSASTTADVVVANTTDKRLFTPAGGLDFFNCRVEGTQASYALQFIGSDSDIIEDVQGTITDESGQLLPIAIDNTTDRISINGFSSVQSSVVQTTGGDYGQ